MSAARGALADLLAEGSLDRPDVTANLLRQAGNHLRTAAAGASTGDDEGAFQLAYDASRKTCLARPRDCRGGTRATSAVVPTTEPTVATTA